MDAIDYYNRGIAKGLEQDYNGAIEYYTKAIEINPYYAGAYYNRAIQKRCIRDYEGAIEDCTKTIETDSLYVEAYNTRALTKVNKQDYDGAIEDCTKAIEIDPSYVKAYNTRAAIKETKKDYNGAIEDCTKAIEVNPYYAEAYNTRGLMKEAKKDYNGAIEDYTKAIEIDPNRDFYFSRAFVKYTKKDYKGSIDDYIKVLEIDPNYEKAYNNLGLAYFENGDYDDARELATEFLKIDPSREWARNLESLAEGGKKGINKEIDGEYKKILNNTKILQKKNETLVKNTENLQKMSEGLFTATTPQSLSRMYNTQAEWRFLVFVGLRISEFVIYCFVIWHLYYYGFPFFESLLKNSDFQKTFIVLLMKITIFIPISFLLYLLHKTSQHFHQRSELDGDICVKWVLFKEIELEVKGLEEKEKYNSEYMELYKNIMKKKLEYKTNFELLEDAKSKRIEKKLSPENMDNVSEMIKKLYEIIVAKIV